ncbi:unnamed protein product [Dibothriocephalus latus]|uniref:Integrase catalytic domain-containing protein n=1 Tax=Dibothriocephalus latus TaxID=60516 RepID=A0A3P6UJB0_DIBLA|nr:unnamed protein product [Dibothriocephalus latus]
MHQELKAWARDCVHCQRSKVWQHSKAHGGKFSGPGPRFNHIHLDVLGTLLLPIKCSYLLTCVYRSTRWPEAIFLPNVEAFLRPWVAVSEAPSTITTDRGAQFECDLFQSLPFVLGLTRIHPADYHLAAHWMVEGFHRQLKASPPGELY